MAVAASAIVSLVTMAASSMVTGRSAQRIGDFLGPQNATGWMIYKASERSDREIART